MAFGSAFQRGAFQADAFQIVMDATADTRDGIWDVGRANRTQDDRESRVTANAEALRRSIDRAFRRANGEPDPDELAVEIEDALLADGLRARTEQIEQMIAMLHEEREDEDAAVVLLLS